MKKRFLALLLTLVMVLAIVPQAAFAANGSEATASKAEPTAEIKADGTKAAGDVTYLAFTSDIHNGAGGIESNISNNRLTTWLSKVMQKYNNEIQLMGFCGDMAGANTNTSTFWTCTQVVMDNISNHGMTGVYAVGNHEYGNGSFATTSNSPEVRAKYKLNAEARAEDDENYVIYCLGTNSSHGSDWAYDDSQITSLTNYMNSVSNDKVIIILTHFPLHDYGMHRTGNTVPVLNAINAAAVGADGTYGTSDDKKIVFLWGHNHSEGDSNYDQVWKPGEKINDSAKSTVYFYYAAAGCMADSEYGQSSMVKGKGLVLEIDVNKKLSFTYYDAEGNNVTEGGTFTEKDPEPITSATVPGTTETGTSGTVNLTNPVKVGRSVQLSVSVQPTNSSYEVNWTSQTPSIATVDNTGEVTGVSEGTATITVNIIDKVQRASKTLNVQVTVTAGATGNVFVLTDALEDGEEYLIVNTNASGSAYALKNPGGTSGGAAIASTSNKVSVTIDGDEIETDEESIVWTAEANGSGFNLINNDTDYLEGASGNVSVFNPQKYSARYWTYNSSHQLQHKGGQSTYTLRYSSSSNYFQGSTSSNSSYTVYLFKRQGAQIDPQSITVSPATTEVQVGKSVQLAVAVTPSNASKKVTWMSSSSAATVDSTGKVTGVTEGGTAVITATTPNGLTATCSVTVTANTMPQFIKVNSIKADGEYLIVNTSTVGSAYALSNPGGTSSGATVGAVVVTVETGDIIHTDAENIVWTATKNAQSSSGYDLRNGTDYLEGKGGNLGSFNSQQYPERYWTYDGTYLQFVGGSYTYELYYENGFTARSFNSGDATHPVYIYEKVTEQVAVTGVTVSPTTATVEVRDSVQLNATVAPENATNKKVTWSSDKPEIASVDENGKVKGVAVGTAKITATTADGGKTASCNVTVTPRTTTDPTYVIVVDGNALSINRSPNTAQGGSSSYTYTGLAGVAYTSGDADNEICWIFEKTDGGYYIRSLDGKYLNATYTSGNNSGNGDLKLDDTKDVWVLDSGYSLEDGTVDGSKLKSTNATNQAGTNSGAKYLSYEDSQNLFTVRSSGNADPVTIEEIETPSSGSYYVKVEADKTEVLPGDVITFTVKLGPITGFGSMEMTIDDIPAGLKYVEGSGDMVSGIGETLGFDFNIENTGFTEDPLMINGFGTADKTLTAETAIATFQCEVEEDFEGPATITLKDLEFYSVITWNKLDVTAIGATVTLHEHSYTGEPVWNWAEDKSSATATFTCTDCVAETPVTETVNATVTSAAGTGENAGYTVYTATVTFNGKTYNSIEKTPIVYAISYNLGSDDAVVEGTNPTSYTVEDGPITLINPTREGYNFLGWTGTGITGASTSVTIAKGSTGDRSYTATWEVSGYEVSGSITSYVGYRDSDPNYNYVEGKVSVKLYVSGSEEAAYEAVVSSDNKTYTIAGVAAGTYEMEVAKKDHVTRTYEITVGTEAVTQDVKIHLLGDIDGDGILDNFDAARSNSHNKGKSLLKDYQLKCGDIDGDGDIDNFDAARINSHSKGKSYLW